MCLPPAQECQLEGAAAASCALVTDFQTGESHGTMPCTSCSSSQPICLVTKGGTGKGVCSCLQTGAPVFQSCRGADVTDRVMPDVSQLCALSLDARRQSTRIANSVDWNSLAASPCAIVSASNAYCYNVPGYGYLVVGLGNVDTTAFGRRRLLGAAEQDRTATPSLRDRVLSFDYWNATLAKPCSALATAAASSSEKSLSITDTSTLESCIFWRQIGRDAIAQLNLTSLAEMEADEPWMAPDRIFMSLDDFASLLSSRSV